MRESISFDIQIPILAEYGKFVNMNLVKQPDLPRVSYNSVVEQSEQW